MVGLPYTVTEEDIDVFFHGFGMLEDSIKIGKYSNGKTTGQAVVAFQTADDATMALNDRYKQYIGSRFIELFPLTLKEYEAFPTIQTETFQDRKYAGGAPRTFRGDSRGGRGGRGRGGEYVRFSKYDEESSYGRKDRDDEDYMPDIEPKMNIRGGRGGYPRGGRGNRPTGDYERPPQEVHEYQPQVYQQRPAPVQQ